MEEPGIYQKNIGLNKSIADFEFVCLLDIQYNTCYIAAILQH